MGGGGCNSIVLEQNYAPIVDSMVDEKVSLMDLFTTLVLPTDLSPTITILKVREVVRLC